MNRHSDNAIARQWDADRSTLFRARDRPEGRWTMDDSISVP